MALDFPASPTNGQVYGSYVYNSAVGAWQAREDSATVATISTVFPTNANPGDIWYDSDDGTSYIYYDDGTSAQWVELLSSGVPLLNTKANLAGGNALTGVQSITSTATTQTPLIVNGIASQTANLQEWKNSAGVTQASVAYDGKMNIGSSLTFADPGVGVETRFTFNRATDGAWLSVLERAADSTVYEFGMSDNPDANDYFQWKFIDWQNPSSGWMPLQIGGFVNRIIGLNSQFWGNIQTVSNTPFFTTNDGTGGTNEKIGYYAPQTSTTYNLNKDSGTGTGTLNVDVSGYNVNSVTTFRVVIDSGATTFSWGYGSSTTQGTGITITGGWQVLAGGVSIKLSTTGNVAGDRWAFRAFPVSKFALGGTPLTTSMSSIYPKAGMNGLVIRGDSGQTADLQQWQNSSGTVLAEVSSVGLISARGFESYNAANNIKTFSIGDDIAGQVEIGRTDGVAANPYIDFHSGATATDFDSRIQGTGGNGTSGNGSINISASSVNFTGRVSTSSQPAFSATSTSAWTTISPGNPVVFNSSQFNIGGHYNTSNGRFTAPVAGRYIFAFNFYIDGQRQASFRKNGSDYIPSDTAIAMSATGTSTTSASYLFNLAAGDYIEVGCRSGSTSLYFYSGHSWFMGYMLG